MNTNISAIIDGVIEGAMDRSPQPKPDSPTQSVPNTAPDSSTLSVKVVELEDLKTASDAVEPVPAELHNSISRTRTRARLIGLIAAVAVVAAVLSIAGVFLSKRSPTTLPTQKTLTDSELQKLSTSNIGYDSSKQSLTFHSPAAFDKGLTVDGVTTIKDLVVTGTYTNSGSAAKPDASGNTQLQGQVTAKGLQVNGNLIVNGTSTFNGGAAFAGALSADSISVKSASIGGLSFGHVITIGANPTGSIGIGAGGGSFQISGNDTSGTVIINVGGGAHTGDLVNVAFRTPFTSTPHVNLTPVSSSSAGTPYYVTRSVTAFTVGMLNPVPGAQYIFDYFVTQ